MKEKTDELLGNVPDIAIKSREEFLASVDQEQEGEQKISHISNISTNSNNQSNPSNDNGVAIVENQSVTESQSQSAADGYDEVREEDSQGLLLPFRQ